MSTQRERIVRVVHEDGRRYAMSEHAFNHDKQTHLDDKTFKDAGFTIESYEDGTPYEEGKQPTQYAIDSTARSPEIGAVEEEAPAEPTARSRRSNGESAANEAPPTPEPTPEAQ